MVENYLLLLQRVNLRPCWVHVIKYSLPRFVIDLGPIPVWEMLKKYWFHGSYSGVLTTYSARKSLDIYALGGHRLVLSRETSFTQYLYAAMR